MNDTATQIVEKFEQHGITVDHSDVLEQLETLTNEFQVPKDEAVRSVVNQIADEHDVERNEMRSNSDLAAVGDIDSDGNWVDIEVTVDELWDPNSDSIAQVGLVGDESGTIKFISWASSELPSLEKGESYRLENVVTDEYQGRYSIKLNANTEITLLDEEIEVGDNETELEGAVVAVQPGSGLIKRCPDEDCTRVLNNGRCAEHGKVDGDFDLRIKAVLDDGSENQHILFDEEATEELTGIDLFEAIEMAQDALDTSVVADEITDQVIGHYLAVSGPKMGQYLLVNEISEPAALDHAPVLSKVEAI